MSTQTTGQEWYNDQLQDPRWDARRIEILKRDRHTCRHCGATETELHVHHIAYGKNLQPWEYPSVYLKTLCDVCHEIEHTPKSDLEAYLLTETQKLHEALQTPAPYRMAAVNLILKYLKLNKG